VYDGTGHIGNLGQVVAQAVPSQGYPASAPVTIPPLGAVWLRFEPVATEEQSDPDKVAAGVRAAARAVSPHRFAAEEERDEEVEVPAEDPVRPASTEQLGSPPATSAPDSADEALIGGPPDPVSPPAVTDPMTSAEAASPVPSASPDSPGSPPSPESPASPDSPPASVADSDR
jgi:1,4-alpha-glucan branching enzyme